MCSYFLQGLLFEQVCSKLFQKLHMIITFIHSCGVVVIAVNNSDNTQPVDCINTPVLCASYMIFQQLTLNMNA